MASSHTKIAIGAFTLGGIALFLLALLTLSGGGFGKESTEYVLYFKGSVSGLSVGAPVVFRGVPLGKVTKINMVYDQQSSTITIPVYIQLDETSIVGLSGEKFSEAEHENIIKHMVQNGLLASLQIQNLVTGQYRIELDYHKIANDSSADIPKPISPNNIPTMPSPIDTLQKSIKSLPMQQIALNLNKILGSLDKALGDGTELNQAIASFHKTFDTFNQTLTTIQTALTDSPIKRSAEASLANVQSISTIIHRELPTLLGSLESTMQNLSQTSERLKRISSVAEQLFAVNAPVMQDIRRLFKESAEAARSLHNLAEMLNRNPEALLKGKQRR
ncbi:MAG: MCE family protein [Desulfovibrio sp.]|nr:MCE family protein [Desulfovibrio sp.]